MHMPCQAPGPCRWHKLSTYTAFYMISAMGIPTTHFKILHLDKDLWYLDFFIFKLSLVDELFNTDTGYALHLAQLSTFFTSIRYQN